MSNTISRRSLTKGAAWTVPAVVVAANAPALAASPTRDCEQGPYLTIQNHMFYGEDEDGEIYSYPDRRLSPWTAPAGEPTQGSFYQDGTEPPRNYVAANLLIKTTGEFAPGAQVTVSMTWDWKDYFRQNPGSGAEPTSDNVFREGIEVAFGRIVRGSGFEPATDPGTLDISPIAGEGTEAITLTVTNTGTVALEQEIPIVVFFPVEPRVTYSPDEGPPEENFPNAFVYSDAYLEYTATATDQSECSYESTTGDFWIPILAS